MYNSVVLVLFTFRDQLPKTVQRLCKYEQVLKKKVLITYFRTQVFVEVFHKL